MILSVELDGKGGGTGWLSFDPNKRSRGLYGIDQYTLIGVQPVRVTLKVVRDENQAEKGRRMYEVSGGQSGRLCLVFPAETTSPCWLVIAGTGGVEDMIVMRRG